MSTKRAQSIVGYNGKREKDDFYVTPPEAVTTLLRVESFYGRIWEPACGNGSISEVLKKYGLIVISSDIVDRGYRNQGIEDFLTSPKEVVTNSVITNPPYNLAEEFVTHALEVTNHKVAMLLKLVFLEGQKRKQLFQTTPLKRVWVFSKRLKLTGADKEFKNGGMIAFAWFVWEHGYRGEPTIGWI